MNINRINFHERNNNLPVDDVILIEENIIKNKNVKKKEKHKNIEISIINNEKDEKYYHFVEKMKNNLESLNEKVNDWINIIFGTNQKYNNKKEQYFRTESYIDNDDKTIQKYVNNNIIMDSVEFGLIPLQIISEKKLDLKPKKISQKIDSQIKNEINNIRKKSIKNNIAEKKAKEKEKKGEKEEEKEEENKEEKIKDINENKQEENNNIEQNNNKNDIELLDDNYFNKKNKYKEYWDDSLPLKLEICNEKNIGKLIIKYNDIIKSEIIDHNNIIIDYYYNRRLNMFATTSCDGFICVYMLPSKLITMIKNPNNSYYDKILLSSNPFPSIIAFSNNDKTLTSYSLIGIKIKTISITNVENKELKIEPIFNKYGGIFKDRINISYNIEDSKILSVPFFEEI